MITAKINCSLIDKTKLFKGEKGTYLDIVLIETENDRYGNDYMVVQGISKEERAAGKKGVILGNAKVFEKKQQTKRPAQKQSHPLPQDDDGEKVPF